MLVMVLLYEELLEDVLEAVDLDDEELELLELDVVEVGFV
jgi:hypothetical protein